ncbi:MAG TPA: aminoacyl-tRNA hydrolase [Candidatus Scatomorpha stercorigallinarum]|nr:aminoacyl-tRNA hydrolase [Candidatus Scatomorpha stercorigallinarum]
MLFPSSRAGGVEWIAAFLGNPGPQYEGTRHNAGFMAGTALAKDLGVSVTRLRHRALTATADIGGHKTLLMLPQTYMNLSGEAVGEAARFYKVPPGRVIVVSDEMALPPGVIRVRPGGSAGGHNGLKSIIAALGTEQFPRIRLGVGEPPHPEYDTADWVLGRFAGEDVKLMEDAAARAAQAVRSYITDGAEKTMGRFNQKHAGPSHH